MTENVDTEREEAPKKVKRDRVATVLVGTWTDSVDSDRLKNVLDGDIPFDERTMLDDDTDEGSVEEHEPVKAGAGH